MNKCENNDNSKKGSSQEVVAQAMAFTYFYAYIYFEVVKIFLIKRPKDPPQGYFTSFLVLLLVVGIFSCLTCIGIARMTFGTRPVKKKRRRKRSVNALARRKSKQRNSRPHASEGAQEDTTFYEEVLGSIPGTDLMANSNSQLWDTTPNFACSLTIKWIGQT